MVAEQRGQNPRDIGVSPESPHRTRSKGKRTPKKLSSLSCGESVAEDCRECLGLPGVRRRSSGGHVDTSGFLTVRSTNRKFTVLVFFAITLGDKGRSRRHPLRCQNRVEGPQRRLHDRYPRSLANPLTKLSRSTTRADHKLGSLDTDVATSELNSIDVEQPILREGSNAAEIDTVTDSQKLMWFGHRHSRQTRPSRIRRRVFQAGSTTTLETRTGVDLLLA